MRKVVMISGIVLAAIGMSLPIGVYVHEVVWNLTHVPEIVAEWGSAPLSWLLTRPFYPYHANDWGMYMGGIYLGLILAIIGMSLIALPKDKETG